MSDGYLFLDQVVVEQPVRQEQSYRDVFLFRLLIALACVLFLESVYFFIYIPFQPLTKVYITPSQSLSQKEIATLSGLHPGSSYFSVDTTAIERTLLQHPLVEQATVKKLFPSGLTISIIERSAVALALAKVDGKLCPVYIDRQGVVFKVGSDTTVSIDGKQLPMISGLVFDKVVLGMKLPAFMRDLFQDLHRIERQNPALLEGISEFRVVQKPYGGYELIAYPIFFQGKVLLGTELKEDTLRYMMLVLDVLAEKGIQTDEIDFRGSTIMYRTKEASSG
ncbi:MAG: FtsQ-type POTRA domain-containing protein [Termitinemataceae bacterium]